MKLRRRRILLNWPLGQRQRHFMRRRARRALVEYFADRIDRLTFGMLLGRGDVA